MFRQKEKRISSQEPSKIWFWSAVLVIVCCLFSYGFLVRGAIVNIVVRQNMEQKLSVLSSQVIDLESDFIRAKNKINKDYAEELGFVNVFTQKFITQNTDNLGLSLLISGN